jgi:PhzF family phenazine biosynthesis protein
MNDLYEKSTVTAHIINGFVCGGEGGNPAGVVFDSDGLSDAQMLQIATKVGLSETAFVSASSEADYKLDFFTPNRRIAHCGHATIAAFAHMAQTGRVSEGETSKMTVDGPRRIIIKDGQAFMEQTAPNYLHPDNWTEKNVTLQMVLDSIGLSQDDLVDDFQPCLVNTGNSFVIIAVRNEEILAGIKPKQDAIKAISDRLDLIGYYPFALSPETSSSHATTRMFAPRYAIAEEAATGMAAGPLGCYIYDIMGLRQTRMKIEQGHFMKPASPSEITVDLQIGSQGNITSLTAGGYGRCERKMEISIS